MYFLKISNIITELLTDKVFLFLCYIQIHSNLFILISNAVPIAKVLEEEILEKEKTRYNLSKF